MDNLLNGTFSLKILILLLPLIILQFSFMMFCVLKIVKEGVGNLNELTWILIVVFINLLGPILYLLVGRKK